MALLNPEHYTVVWFAPLEIEAQAAVYMLDNKHAGQFPKGRGDDYVYQAGDAGGHNIIIATLPAGQAPGVASAAALASQVKKFFPNLWFGLLVGVASGVPNLSDYPVLDIRLGDVLIGLATDDNAGLIAYEWGREEEDGFRLLRHGHALADTEAIVRSAIGSIRLNAPEEAACFLPYYDRIRQQNHAGGTFIDPGQDKDVFFQLDDTGAQRPLERNRRPDSWRTRVWYGPLGSGDKIVRNAQRRDELRDRYEIIGLEMEAAGIMNRIPVGVIRGVCNYADEHENSEWRPYAAAMAAAYARAVLAEIMPMEKISMRQPITRETILSRKPEEESSDYVSGDESNRASWIP